MDMRYTYEELWEAYQNLLRENAVFLWKVHDSHAREPLRLKLTVAITGDRDDSFSVFGLNLLGITAITEIYILIT